ncbi:class I SAM-dependent methyltransferase [Stenotrophomonas pigmentata]|uniref:class I SAM-dependent methyltransferase n=1 Tax=Stenotrophomonas pigmentata TaxID=3055080 RepID=UPI0026EDDCFC|nr:class I SAM-dependent methyltransferase [Stenotrophomonas sp. 610A2]
MKTNEIRFHDGATYERYMGVWSQLAGEVFLDWLDPAPAQQWLDVGCGNGAFTTMIIERGAPSAAHGVDPSPQQLAYARAQAGLQRAVFEQADAMALPYPEATFDVAVMPLVIFFVPDPAHGIAEMARVVRPGGTVAAYAWDMPGGGFPYEMLLAEMRGLGHTVPSPPSPEASRIEVLRQLWSDAGLEAIETREIDVSRTFADFEDFWSTALGAPNVGSTLAAKTAGERALLKDRISVRLAADTEGHITCHARANAVKGRVPDQTCPG